MSLGAHLEELRLRLIRCIVLVVVAFIAAWIFRERIMSVLFQPHMSTAARAQVSPDLKFRDYMEPVAAQLKASLAVSLAVTAPYLLYQIWAFVAPGLFKHERHFFTRLLSSSILCFVAGTVFGYFLFIPVALGFLLSLAPGHTEPVLMMGSYLSLFLMMTVALGIVFQTPLVVYYLVKWDIVDIATFNANRKKAIMAAVILAAFFTPPDPATQLMMAVPIIFLYELGILAASPDRKSLVRFSKFAAPVVLAALAVLAWHHYRPAARLAALDGEVSINGIQVARAEGQHLQPGDVLETGDTGRALLYFGFRGERESILLDIDTSVSVLEGSRISVQSGGLLARSRRPDPAFGLEVPRGRVGPVRGMAEVLIEDPESFKVTVLSGEVELTHEGRRFDLSEGRSRTFRTEDDAAPEEDLRERWGDLFREM